MCGISGIWAGHPTMSSPQLLDVLGNMTDLLAHRGPDGSGLWHDAETGLYLGHRRLSIIDISERGRQPMASPSGRYVMTYNGEIYNHLEIRDALGRDATAYRGHSDTESLLALMDEQGIKSALQAANGMFAMGIWDRQEKKLVLARDRFGKKPLYYGLLGNNLVFASELKSLRQFPGWQGELDHDALQLYLRFSYVPAPYSIYKAVHKLTPGCLLEISLRNGALAVSQELRFWDPHDALGVAGSSPFHGSDREIAEHAEVLFSQAVRRRMIADVPLGAFLSGGIDSSAIVAMMQKHTSGKVRTFTIGFHDKDYDEAPFAKRIAQHLGTEHTEMYVSKADIQGVIPMLPQMFDEPFADSSQLPTFLVSQLARQSVTVALSGDGGDEVFGGYNRHLWASRFERIFEKLPSALRRMIGVTAGHTPQALFALINLVRGATHKGSEIPLLGDKVGKFASGMSARDVDELYLLLCSVNATPDEFLQSPGENIIPDEYKPSLAPASSLAARFMYCDTLTYLPGDILTKVDRCSMAVSLETRCPFLDPELVEWAARLPQEAKIRNGKGKWPVRQMLSRYVPGEMFERPKTGFGIPIGDWLKTDLNEWAQDLLANNRLKREGLLNTEKVKAMLEEHVSGRKDHVHRLWNILMLESWLDEDNAR